MEEDARVTDKGKSRPAHVTRKDECQVSKRIKIQKQHLPRNTASGLNVLQKCLSTKTEFTIEKKILLYNHYSTIFLNIMFNERILDRSPNDKEVGLIQ